MKFSKTPIALAAITLLAGAPLAAQAAVSVNFKAPSSGATLNNVSWNNTSACEVSGSGIVRAQFVLINSSGNVTNLNTDTSSPFRCNLVSSNYSNGNYTLRVYAYDSAGNRASSSRQITIKNGTVTDAKPKVSITAPLNNATISALTTCKASASDDKGVKQVEFFVDGKSIRIDGSSGYTCTLDNKLYTNGAHTLMARVTDSLGQTTDSAPITFNVKGGISTSGGTGNNPPILTIDAPAAGSTLSGTQVPFAATATDTTGTVSKVEIYLVSGTTQKLVATDTTMPYSGTFSTSGMPNGPATLMAVATDSLNAKSTVQRSVTINNTVVSNPDTGGNTSGGSTGSVDPAHIISRAAADAPFSSQSGYSAQAMGSTKSVSSIPESGINGNVLSNGETLRLGKGVDPVNSLHKAFAFQVATSDPLTSGGKRSELSMEKNIEMNKVYWVAVSAFVHDWGTLSDTDDSLFGLQLHAGGGENLGGPAFGIYTTQNGRTFSVQAKYSTSATPTGDNAVRVRFAEYPMPFGRWADFVVKFKENTSGNGFLQVWMDGQLITNYQGSLGYNTGVNDYMKFGYYNWSGSAMSSTPRKVLLRSPTIVKDPTGSTYSQDQIRALVSPNASASVATSATSGTTQTADSGVCSTASCVLNQ